MLRCGGVWRVRWDKRDKCGKDRREERRIVGEERHVEQRGQKNCEDKITEGSEERR
jgi:hypothetical protein